MIKLWPALLALLLAASPLYAHSALQSSNPASGSVLTTSPPAITLTFTEETRMTSLVLVTSAGERRLAFTPAGNARSFTSRAPQLAPGRNEIRWRTLSGDGHVVEGSVIIVLRRPAR